MGGMALARLLPRGPVLGWSSFHVVNAPGIASVEDIRHKAYTTSGRAAIYQALLQLKLPQGSTVLVPTYHCPTMVAPVILANLNVAYFGIDANGLPLLDTIDAQAAPSCKAMLVSHYFGRANSLAEVRQWCDERGIALIEDCAHCFFGDAGDRPIGAWGDIATASLSKFLPIPEGGVLASAHRPIAPLRLAAPSLKAQLKGVIDVLELAARHQRFTGLNTFLRFVFRLKNARAAAKFAAESQAGKAGESTAETVMRDCDMARIAQAPLKASMALRALLPRGRIIVRRQQNYDCYAHYLHRVPGAHPLFGLPSAAASQIAPYVFPLWVDDADRVYLALRASELPVFRWDRIWPGTPELDGDFGPLWSRHVLQLLCHQDLSQADVEQTCRTVISLLQTQP